MNEDEIAALQQRYGQQVSLSKDIDTIIEVGRTHHSSSGFDDASQIVAETLGDKTNDVMQVLTGFDHPHDVIMHLANNEPELKRLKTLTPQRQAIEIAKIEARLNSNAIVSTGAEPAYKQPATRNGKVSDEDWSRTYGVNLSEKQWEKEFWRRQEERAKRRR